MTAIQNMVIDQVIILIRNAKEKYSEARIAASPMRKDPDLTESTKLACDADRHLDRAREWLKALMEES